MRNISDNKKNILFMILSGIIVCIISLCIYFLEIRPKVSDLDYDIQINNEDFKVIKEELTSDKVISQTFTTKECITGIKVGLKSYDNAIRGKATINLYDIDDDLLIGKWQYEFDGNNTFSNYEDGYFKFAMIEDPFCILSAGVYNKEGADKSYKVEITSDSSDNRTAPIVYISENHVYDKGNLYINGNFSEGDLYLKAMCKQGYYISKMFIIISVITVFFAMSIYYLIFVKKLKIEKIFLVSAIVLGFVYMIIMTPYSVSDESGHINTAYRYSNWILGKGYQTENGNMLKRKCDIQEYNLAMRPSVSTYYGVTSHFFDSVSDEDKELVEVPGESIGNFWQYIPTSIGITVARLLNLGYIPLIYVGRIFNFAFFLSMIYLGIKKLPFGKMTLFSVAMMPMALHQGMSFSYDAIVYGLSFIFISYIMYIAFTDKKIKKTDIIIPIIAAGVLATCKAGIFIFLALICFIIPKDKFKDKKKYFEVIGTIITGALLMLLVFNVMKISRAVTMTTNDDLQNFSSMSGYTYIDIIKEPGNFIYSVYSTILHKGDFYVLSTIGGFLSWSTLDTVEVSKVIVICYIVIILVSSLKIEGEKKYLLIKHKIIFSFVSLLIFGAFLTVAYTWTPQGRNIIFGLQGRYFVPFTPLLAFLFRNNIVTTKKNINKQLMFSLCVLEIVTVLNLFSTIASSK